MSGVQRVLRGDAWSDGTGSLGLPIGQLLNQTKPMRPADFVVCRNLITPDLFEVAPLPLGESATKTARCRSSMASRQDEDSNIAGSQDVAVG